MDKEQLVTSLKDKMLEMSREKVKQLKDQVEKDLLASGKKD